jgi:hypothetical protein
MVCHVLVNTPGRCGVVSSPSLGRAAGAEYHRISEKITLDIARIPKKISAGRGERRCAPGPPRPIWEPIFQGVARGVIGCQGGGSEAAALAREAGASARSTPRRMTENATNCYRNGSYLRFSRRVSTVVVE